MYHDAYCTQMFARTAPRTRTFAMPAEWSPRTYRPAHVTEARKQDFMAFQRRIASYSEGELKRARATWDTAMRREDQWHQEEESHHAKRRAANERKAKEDPEWLERCRTSDEDCFYAMHQKEEWIEMDDKFPQLPEWLGYTKAPFRWNWTPYLGWSPSIRRMFQAPENAGYYVCFYNTERKQYHHPDCKWLWEAEDPQLEWRERTWKDGVAVTSRSIAIHEGMRKASCCVQQHFPEGSSKPLSALKRKPVA